MKELTVLKQPPINNITKYFKHYGLVGEENVGILQTLMAIKRIHFGIESLSGGGKSATMDLLANHKINGDNILLPPESVYVMSMGSKTAQFYKAYELNQAKIIYIEELQKIGASLEVTEMLKNLAEGKDFTRDVTNAATGTVDTQKIDKGKGLMYTLALENSHKNDAEMKRRFVVLTTDVSEGQTKQVLKRKSRERFAPERLEILNDEELLQLKTHIKMCLDLTNNFEFQNPYAESITSFMPTPDQKVRSFVNHYFNVVEAVALYNYKDRHKKGKELFINLEDCWIAHTLYGPFFNKDIHSVPPMGMEILKAFNDMDYDDTLSKKTNVQKGLNDYDSEIVEHKWATITDIHRHLKKYLKIVLTHNVTRDICNLLYDAGYLDRNTGTKITEYQIVENPKGFSNVIDWEQVYEEGMKNMKKHRPEEYDGWKKKQNIKTQHPITMEEVNITKLLVEDNTLKVEPPKVFKEFEEDIAEEITIKNG